MLGGGQLKPAKKKEEAIYAEKPQKKRRTIFE